MAGAGKLNGRLIAVSGYWSQFAIPCPSVPNSSVMTGFCTGICASHSSFRTAHGSSLKFRAQTTCRVHPRSSRNFSGKLGSPSGSYPKTRSSKKWAFVLAAFAPHLPRGEVELIFASVGATLLLPGASGALAPVVSDATYGAIICVVLITTLVGLVMKKTKGQANPKLVSDLLKSKLT